MSEVLKNRIRQFVEEIWHKGNLGAIDEFIAPDYIRHTSQFREGGRDVHGPEDGRKSIAALRASFPDIHFDLEDILAEGDKVVARWTCTGTHRGEFRGIAPTGKRVAFSGMNIYRLRDGKIVERWGVEDGLSLLQQLGALP
jgi:steroid delta-isomerase-like uncharacterized protein